MLRRFAGITGLLVLCLTSLAQAQSYATRKTDYKAGIVVIDSAQGAISGQPLNYTPHVWFNLDQNFSVKPAGMNIYNPRATTQVTQAVVARWGPLASDVGGVIPLLAAPLTKASAPYWEVRLSTVGEAQLADYDVLLLSAYGYTNLNPVERDKLRKFVDQGGVLWLDIASTTNFSAPAVQVNTFPLPFERLNLGGTPLLTDADIFSPLMTTPYSLSIFNLEQIRLDMNSFAQPIQLGPLGMGGYWQIESWIESDYFMHLNPIATHLGSPTVMVGKIGDGFVVVTTSKYAMALNQVATGGGGYDPNIKLDGAAPTFDRTTQLAAKFAVNVLNLASGYRQPGGGARKPNSIPIDLNPPLLGTVKVEDVTGPNRNQSPALYKGLLVATWGGRVRVYDAKPKADLDADGDPDDGMQDASLGQNYDLLWESGNLSPSLSAPTCAEVPGSLVKDQIFVVGETGVVYAFDAFDLLNGRINPNQVVATPIYTIDPPVLSQYPTGIPGAGPYAPTFHDGLLYMADVASAGNTGLVWVADPVSQAKVQTAGTSDWFVGAGGGQTLPEPTGSPTIGLIPIQDNSGGYDRVAYIPGRPNGAAGPTGTATITSLWLGVRGESPPPNSVTPPPSDPSQDTTALTIVTRAARQGLAVYSDTSVPIGAYANRALGVKLTMLHPNGDPFTNTEMAFYFTGTVTESGGILTFPINSNHQLPTNFGVRLDYSIDWGAPDRASHISMSTQVMRGQLNLPDDYNIPSNSRRRVIGNVAMSPRGTIYCIVSSQNPTDSRLDGGSFYAIREDIGRGGFRLLTRYNLYPKHSIPLNQARPGSYDETLRDNDAVLGFMPPFMSGAFTHLTFMGTPSVRNGVVYVTASGRKASNPFIPFTILLAFKAEPEAPEIRIGDIPDGFTLRQYDIDRSLSHTAPTTTNDMSQGQFSYDRSDGTVRFDNLMTTNRGVMVNAFSTSQPVVIRRPNQPDQLIDPDTLGARWSPLLWYSVMHGLEATGSPFTSGGSVFVPGTSILPNLTQLPAIVLSGMVEAWKADVAANDQYLVPDGNRPWNHQLWTMLFTGGGPNPNPDLLWPQFSGLRDFSDFVVRIRQTKLGNSSTVHGIVGGEGVLGAWGDRGVYAFSRADFIIADEGRLGRFDASGNPLWISNLLSSTGTTDVGVVGAVKPLVRPVKAYPVGENDIIVADAGANRIARLDLSGRELRSITSFILDPANVPDGFKASEPLTLNSPRDVVLFTTYELNFTQFWVHYLIADTGNKRLIELVDKYTVNPNRQITDVVTVGTVRQIGVLHWHSPANYTGKTFDYNSVSRVWVPAASGPGGSYYYAAGIGSAMPTRADTGLDTPSSSAAQQRESAGGNGGVAIFNPADPSLNVIINEVLVPTIPQDAYWNFTTGTFNSPVRQFHMKTLSNVSSVTTRVVFIQGVGTRIAVMFTDATGVYEVYQPTGNGNWEVRWMLSNEAYRALRRIPPPFGTNVPLAENSQDLRATYARRLDDGDVLIVNGYLGKTRGDGTTPSVPFQGEVLQINGDFDTSGTGIGFDFSKPNLGFDISMIVFQLPPINGARGLVLPVFADRR